jgi:hypothetical protein
VNKECRWNRETVYEEDLRECAKCTVVGRDVTDRCALEVYVGFPYILKRRQL